MAQSVQSCTLNMKPQIIEIKQEDKMTGSVILVAGFLFSLWTHCIFVMGATDLRGHPDFIVFTSWLTHVIISGACIKGVLHGIKQRQAQYLQPWIGLKLVEGVLMFVGSVLCATNTWGRYVGLTPVGILFLMLGVYLTLCVWTTYKKMLPVVENTGPENVLPEHPPAYDSFTNQTLK